MSWQSDNFFGDDDQRSWRDGQADATGSWRAVDDQRGLSLDDSSRATGAYDDVWDKRAEGDDSHELLIVPGSGISMGEPFIPPRERPLALRLGILTLMA